jgi:DNA adenine methylase
MSSPAKKFVLENDSTKLLPPPLKWAGGKRWLLPHLIPIYDQYRKNRLVEPFIGGMAVALGLNPIQALLNDANPHVINFYNHLKNGLITTVAMKHEREYFFSQRDRFNQLVREGLHNSKEAAEIFYYMNRTAFNGLCRFNSKGEYNVPFGKYAKINYTKDFIHYKPVLKEWTFSCGDFEKLKIKKDDFIYVDPPYDVEFTKYSKDDFTWDDQERLVEWLNKYKNPMIASNQATDRIIRLYKKAGFKIQKLSAPRMISCTGNRDRAWEMLATKNI